MDLNPICHPSPANKMKCSFLDYIQLLMLARLVNGLKPHPPPLCSQRNEILLLWITLNFWWLAGLSDGLKPHPPPLSSQKKWNAHFWITFTSDDLPGWLMNLNLICHPSPTKKMKCSIFDYIQLLMISQAGQWTQSPSASPLQLNKWNAHFCIMLTLDDQPGWSNDSNPIHHPSPTKKVKCSFLYYIQHVMLARLVNGLKFPQPALSSQKNEMLLFGLRSTSDDRLGWSMDSNPILHLSPAKEMKCSFLYYVQLLMIGWTGRWTRTPSTTPLQPKQWNAHFCITFNIWCWPDWSMDLNLIHHSSPAKNMKWSFLGYIQLLMISQAVRWTQTPSASPLQLIKWNAHFCITFNFWWSAGLIGGLKPHSPPLSSQKNEMLIFWLCSTSDDQLIWSMDLNRICHPSPIKKNEMLIFVLHSTSDDQLSWSVDSNPIHQPSPANKMKYSFLDYVQLLMISWADRWTQTAFITPLHPKKWNTHFLIMFNFWWSAGLVNGLKPHPPPLSSQRNEMLIFVLCSTSNDWLGCSMDSNPIHHPSPAKTVKCSFLYYIQHLMLARLVNGLEPHPPPLCSQKNEMLIFWLCSTSDDQLGWSMDLNPICQHSPANKMKCYFLDYVQLLMLARLVNGLKPHLSHLSGQ